MMTYYFFTGFNVFEIGYYFNKIESFYIFVFWGRVLLEGGIHCALLFVITDCDEPYRGV